MKPVFFLFALGVVAAGTGCASDNHDTMERFGYAKREVLADRVNEACRSQGEASDQFANVLDRFLVVTKFQGGEMLRKYEEFNSELQRCETTAQEVRNRIAAVEGVAKGLFVEWDKELSQNSNPSRHRQSQLQLEAARRRYSDLIKLMRRAAGRMDPVLETFHDQVLFLKHNLNASAMASLDATIRNLEADMTRLIVDMEISIRESEIFVQSLKSV